MKIILTGGGTIGSVSPLLAIKHELVEQKMCSNSDFIWVGTEEGVEKDIIEKENFPYFSIKSGKFRRYFSKENFIDPFRILKGIFQSIKIIRDFNPDYILSAGSFVSVPVVIAGWILRKKTIIHQQDIRPGLANKFMAPFASKITVTFEDSKKYFSKKKTVLTGNPVRQGIFNGNKENAIKFFKLESNLPTLFIMGGSLGAEELNKFVVESITDLIDICQVVHIVGKGNIVEWEDEDQFENSGRYHQYEYLFHELADVYAIADLIVCRAGLSTLTELSALKKPTVLIPIPNNQQEENARYFDSKNAVITLAQEKITVDEFLALIKNLFANPNSLERLGNNMAGMMPVDANKKYVEMIKKAKEDWK
ncbi:undecaprenyldiphospho-muramoylpentapeptide beta-N-acetylglucosaminyltransferase [Candidatus Kuenenbacteria bacterium]|nr:undecaprenyldiphospho-muramoylpentapeptide beta-N-acetylglucosaminyltransferase [Candidatus Kuenenbacteria bacterium]